jgi:plasmid maintenance system antidote protein VapI
MKLLTQDELIKVLNINSNTLANLVNNGKIQ